MPAGVVRALSRRNSEYVNPKSSVLRTIEAGLSTANFHFFSLPRVKVPRASKLSVPPPSPVVKVITAGASVAAVTSFASISLNAETQILSVSFTTIRLDAVRRIRAADDKSFAIAAPIFLGNDRTVSCRVASLQ